MSKLLTVVGGTGTQGLSLINAVLATGSYRVRAVTRNPVSDKAKELASRGVEVVKADLNDEHSLVEAFKDSSAVFGSTDFFEPFTAHGPEKAIEIETSQGINIANAVSKTPTVEHYIWSTLPNAARVTEGKYKIPHFVAKNRVDDYIKENKSLLAKTTFFWITFYGNNFQYPMFTPNLMKTSGHYVQLSPADPATPIWSIGSPLQNIGIFARAILEQPQKTLPGRTVVAYNEETTTGKMLEDWSEVTGKNSVYVQTSLEDFSNVWPMWGLEMGAMMEMWSEITYRSWSGEPDLVTMNELGLTEDQFVSFKGALAEMNWDALL